MPRTAAPDFLGLRLIGSIFQGFSFSFSDVCFWVFSFLSVLICFAEFLLGVLLSPLLRNQPHLPAFPERASLSPGISQSSNKVTQPTKATATSPPRRCPLVSASNSGLIRGPQSSVNVIQLNACTLLTSLAKMNESLVEKSA